MAFYAISKFEVNRFTNEQATDWIFNFARGNITSAIKLQKELCNIKTFQYAQF